jgi:DNA-binding GntR family transcriptional regulator
MSAAEIPYKFLVSAAAPPRGGVTRHVTAQLRRAIVTLALRPGESLDKGLICERLGVSRFPVSEALGRLQREGLVEILPQRGSLVSRVRITDVVEYMLIRRALESEAVRALVMRRPDGLADKLAANLDQQGKAVAAGERERFHQFDLMFHDILFEAMAFERIKAVIEAARANLDRARLLILDPRRLTMTLGEHRAIVEAIGRGDAEGAAEAMRRHIDKVTGELLAFARERPELFADPERLDDQVLPVAGR